MESDFGLQPFIFCNNLADRKQRVAKSKGEEQGSGDEQTPDAGEGSAEGEGIEGKVEDKQGNPINENGSLVLESVNNVSDMTDNDFTNPTRNVKLPILPEKVSDAIGATGRPIVIKKNIFERNKKKHKDLTPEQSREILKSALYNPDLYGQNQKAKRPYNWIVINTKDEKGKNKSVVIEISPNKDNIEIVHWHYIDKKGLEKIKRQAEREDGQLLILPSENSEEVGALSDPTLGLSSADKGTNKSETLQGEKEKSEKGTQENPIDKINEHRATEGLEEVSEEEVALRDALNEQLKKSGIDVVTDVEDGERVLAMAEDNDVKENKVYHGSGADFDEFDHSHIGEGEGAQAFGWGTYLTEVKGIGEGYARKMEKSPKVRFLRAVLTDAKLRERRCEEDLIDAKETLLDRKNYAESLRQKYKSLKARAEQIKSEYGEKSVEYDNFLFNNDLDGAEKFYESTKKWVKTSESALVFYEQNLKDAKQKVSEAQAEYDKETEGHKSILYTVEVPDDNGKNFLHWESQTPSETVEKIRDYVREHCSEEVAEEFDKQIAYGTDNPDLAEYGQNGENVYKALEYALHSDKKASLALSELGMQGISYQADFMRGGRADGARNYVIFKEEDAKITDKVRLFKTKNGKAYGFTVGGKIYVDPRIAKADTPIHEYSHLWASMFRAVNPKEWSNVVKLMKDSPLWEEIRKKYPELKTDDEIADEVLAHFSGKRGAERLRQAQQEAMKEKGVSAKASAISAIERVRKALSTFWKGVCDLLHIHFTSAEEVADRVLSDMLNGVDPMKVKNEAKKGEKTLVGVHNISEDKLEKAMKQGGLANPSLAVIDSSKQKHEGYGDISLIMPSNKVAKGSGKNAGTWQGDAWTPTYPQVERKMSDKGSAKASKDIQSVPKEMQRSVSNGIDRWLEGQSNSEMAYLFLHERGEAPEMQHAMSKYGEDMYNKIKKLTNGNFSLQGLSEAEKNELLSLYIESKFNGDEVAYRRNLEEWVAKNRKRAEENKGLIGKGAKENVELYDKYGIDYKSVERFAQDVRYDHNSTLNPDSNLTTKAAEEYIQSKNLQGEFEKWLEGKTKEYGVKEVIFDGYTPSGKRRYVGNTLENVSRLMKGEGRNGATGWSGSFSDFAARLMPSYSKLEEIRTQKGLLTNDHADVEAFREKWGKVYTELGMKCQPETKGQFDTYGMERLSEAATQKNPQQYLKEEYGVELSDADAKRLNEMIAAIKKEYPAMYFETKYERPVMFNEFASAVVPKTLKESTKEFLRKQGLTLYEYDKDIEGDRQRAFDEASSGEGIRFQFVGEKGAANADKLEEADRRMDNLRVAREMEKSEKDAKSIKIATGWERGADGKWRYEIPDVKYHPEGDAEYKKIRDKQRWSKELDELSDKIFEGENLSEKEKKRFDELAQLESEFNADYLSQEKPYLTNWVENDELFASYPELKQTQILFTDQLPERTAGYYSEKDNTIVVNTKSSLAPESIIAHEVQHAIQRIEGFARGGSIEEIEKDFQRAKVEVRARSWAFQLKETSKELGGDYSQSDVEKALIKEYEDMNMSDMMPDEETRIKGFNYFARGYADRSLDDAIKRFHLDTSTGSNFNSYKEYQKLAGEVESRNVQERMYMTSEERRKSLAAETEDVSREDQTILQDGLGVSDGLEDKEPIVLKGREAENKLNELLSDKNVPNLPSPVSGMSEFKKVFEKPIRTILGAVIKVKDEVFNKISRYGRQNISGSVYSVLTDADFAIREKDGSVLYVKRFKNDLKESVYNVVVVNKKGEIEDYISSVHIKSKNNLINKIKNGAVLLLPNERETYGIQSPGNTTPSTDRKVSDKHSDLQEKSDERYRTSDEIDAEYPNWLEGTTNDNGKHTTQIAGTVKTYQKVGKWIESHLGKDIRILDASSGMGYGTADLKEQGFNIEDVEPYQSEDRKKNNPATYSSYGDIEGKYDYIISNAVLNVVPDDWRSDILHDMAARLNEGGKLFINTRKSGEEKSIKDKIELDSPQEVLVKRNGHIASYQKFFTPQELKEWVEKELGDGYTVEIANEENSGTKGLAAVVVTKTKATSATDPKSKTSRATEISEHLNTPVRVITSEKEMEGLSPRQKKAKGWYNTATGEVVVVVPNNADVADVENTVLHEVIGHDGIRVLFPDEKKLNNALDEMYRVSNKGIKDKIDAETQKMYDAEVSRIMDRKRKEHEAKGEDANATYYTDMAEAHKEASAKREQMRRDATEEYGADLAGRIGEEGFEKMTAEEKTFWGKIKSMLQEALKRLLDGLGIKSLKKWGDKEWAYIYHEAYKRKKNGGNPTVLDLAESAAMREKTGFGKDVREGNGNNKYRDGDDLNSIIENVKANAEQFNAESKDKLSDAVKAIGGDLRAIHKAMLAQREYSEP